MPEYVVQIRQTDAPEGAKYLWEDIATIDVSPKTKRRTVITQALKEAGVEGQDGLVVRVLDADSAKTSTVSYRQPPPELEIN